MKYSLDTSALIDGWVRYYPTHSGLQEKMEKLIESKEARATIEVLRELEKKEDKLTEWAKQQVNLFVPIDEEIQLAVASILAKHPRLLKSGRRRSAADPFVIALAKIYRCKVVTAEPRTKSREGWLRIPDVCDSMGIRCITLLDLIKEKKWTFG